MLPPRFDNGVHIQEEKAHETDQAFRERKSSEGWAKYREIIDKYYASPQYRTLQDRVAKHFDSN